MKLGEGIQELAPFCARLSGAGGWLPLGLALGVLTLVGSLGLLGLSGGFLTGAAIAGLVPTTAALFNFFMPGAGVRFFALLRTVCRWGDRVVTHEGTFRLLAGLRVWLYRCMAQLSPQQIGRQHGGEMLNRLTRDIDALDNLYPRLLLPAAAATLVLTLVALVFALIAPAQLWLPILLIAVVLVVLPLAGWYLGVVLAPELVHGRAGLRRHLLDCSDGLEDYSLHQAAWLRQREKTLVASECWLKVQLGLGRRATVLRALISLLIGLSAWGCLGLLAIEPKVTQLDGPWLAALVLLLLGCAEAMLPLAGACLDLPGTAAAAHRIRAIAGQVPSPHFVDRGSLPADGSIDIRKLHFAWDANTPVFNGLDLSIEAGEHVLLAGASGCGKSSLVQLLTRCEDPQSGLIQIGGVPIASLDETTLRRQIAAASQFSWAKTASLADNLRLADPFVSEERMREILAVVGLDHILLDWRDGLDSWIEEGGASLSGGQRRRLGIARALLREAPITILDEPCEGLDLLSEKVLVTQVSRYLQGRTLLWVSHRESTAAAFARKIEFCGSALV